MTARYVVGDCFDVLATLEPASVDLVVTSPPFLALRSYLPADHPDKAKELGSEATPGAFIDRMLDVVEACARVLAPHGSLVFELGDTYAGGNAFDKRDGEHGAVHDYFKPNPYGTASITRGGGPVTDKNGNGWPMEKSKVLIPQLFAIALAYGFNPLTGRQTEPWRVRNTVAWCRPNPPVGRDGDKFRPATSFLTVACKARDRYWDGDAVRVPMKDHSIAYAATGHEDRPDIKAAQHPSPNRRMPGYEPHSAGAPLLDYWVIPTAPYKGSHYATYPPDLVVPLVKSMCPARVCRVCGKPSTRIVGEVEYVKPDGRPHAFNGDGFETNEQGANRRIVTGADNGNMSRVAPTLGWSDCGHNDWRPGMILDPFAGSGTTLAVATGHGFDCIGIDLDVRNAELARERVGMFLDIEHGAAPAVRPIVETGGL